MLDVADDCNKGAIDTTHILNKFEKMRSEDALRDIRKQYRRNHNLFFNDHSNDIDGAHPDDLLPIYATMANHFNDPGVNALFLDIINLS